MKKEYDIFISYSRLDIGKAQEIKKELEEKSKVTCWMDLDGIESASQFEHVIINAIDKSKAVIFFLSEHSMKSEFAEKEVRYATKTHKKLIPVKIDDSNPEGWFLFNFSGVDVIDYSDVYQRKKLFRDIQSWFSPKENVPYNTLALEQDAAEIHIETDMDCHVQRFHKDMIVAKADEENVIRLGKGKHKLQFIAVDNPKVKDSCEYKVDDVLESDYIEVFLQEKSGIVSAETENLEKLQQEKENLSAEVTELQNKLSETESLAEKRSGEIARLKEQLDRAKKELSEKKSDIASLKTTLSNVKKDLSNKLTELEQYKSAEATVRKRIEEERKRIKERKRVEEEKFKVGNVEFRMIYVEGGTFKMGADYGWSYEKPVHDVTLSDYCIGETVVTQALWKAVMGNNPSCFHGDNLPVEYVSWYDCQEFLRKLNNYVQDQLKGRRFALPTEAQWEFAARGGKKSQNYIYSGGDTLYGVAWYNNNSSKSTQPVKQKRANELGLYDMSGNVREWCQDWYESSYPSSPQTDPVGPSTGSYRVNRGGGWYDDACFCRSANRSNGASGGRYSNLGLRLVLLF